MASALSKTESAADVTATSATSSAILFEYLHVICMRAAVGVDVDVRSVNAA